MLLVSDLSLSTWLDRRITSSGKTQNAVAVYCGVSHSAVSAWRTGARIPDPKFCWKLAEFFDVEIEDVMRMAGHLPPTDASLRDEQERIDPEVREALRRLTPDEQRRMALPAIELAESLIRNLQNGNDR